MSQSKYGRLPLYSKTFEEAAKGELSKVMNKKAENINNNTAKIILEAYDKGLLTNIVDWKLLKK